VNDNYNLGNQTLTSILVGFGINFAKNSVFFTKNGNLLFEAAQNNGKLPLQNLKNLHASISTVRDEIKVNVGSHPFEFDLLKFQQSNDQPKIPLKLFSETSKCTTTQFQSQLTNFQLFRT
jgi:hypothetical protein